MIQGIWWEHFTQWNILFELRIDFSFDKVQAFSSSFAVQSLHHSLLKATFLVEGV